ncbi:MAG: hypothetical protein IAE89_14920 [Anaerolineae bacterium]|nr:hypothetical protein [Anaerolineae bacterium]
MTKFKFSIAQKDERVLALMENTDHKILGMWARDCALRVLPYFEEKYPEDVRPRNAIETLQTWIDSGVFKMSVIRAASLLSHAAARDTDDNDAARSAARACGQAVATAHVPTHSIGAANYALQAIFRTSSNASTVIAREREWQYQHLLDLSQI